VVIKHVNYGLQSLVKNSKHWKAMRMKSSLEPLIMKATPSSQDRKITLAEFGRMNQA